MSVNNKHKVLASVILMSVVATSGLWSIVVNAQDDSINQATFNDDGSVNQPENWRRWVFVGAPITPNALNGGEAPFPEFHNVYVEPSAFEAYEKTGKWPEGTQIAKELTSIYENNNDETGASSEVSGRHKPEPYEKTAEAFPADSCNACHAANAADDFVFTQFYPVLRAAKGK